MTDDSLRVELLAIVGEGAATFTPHHNPDDLHDESLHQRSVEPFAVVRPATTQDVVAIVQAATRHDVPITPRGSGTGLSGAATPTRGGIVMSFERMNRVLRLDVQDQVVVVQPGLTLHELNEALDGTGLHYPVHPGELSGSLGGNVNTNAGGMRAVRHGVTRQHVLGLELVLADASVVRTGGPVVKVSSGYDLTQLIVGSEGTLALVTEVTLRLSPKMNHTTTTLVPFASLEEVTRVVPKLIASGLQPAMLEYLDTLTLAALSRSTTLELGVDPVVESQASAYLIVILETRTAEQLEIDLVELASLLEESGALDTYVLDERSAVRMIQARERLFWVTKESGANEIVDIVVPRSTVPRFLEEVQHIAAGHGAFVSGCGHVGDGNVHLAVFLPDDEERDRLLRDLFTFALELGGQISGEHGIGLDKQSHYLALTDPIIVSLQQAIKRAVDPRGTFNPYRISDERTVPDE